MELFRPQSCRRNSNCPNNIPSFADTHMSNIGVKSDIPTPFCVRFSHAVDSDPVRSGRVKLLFLSRCPTTIARFIISIIIYTVNRVFWGWSWPHIFIKILKAVLPSLANLNPSPTVSTPSYMRGIFTPVFHAPPYCINRGVRHPVRIHSIIITDLGAYCGAL